MKWSIVTFKTGFGATYYTMLRDDEIIGVLNGDSMFAALTWPDEQWRLIRASHIVEVIDKHEAKPAVRERVNKLLYPDYLG